MMLVRLQLQPGSATRKHIVNGTSSAEARLWTIYWAEDRRRLRRRTARTREPFYSVKIRSYAGSGFQGSDPRAL